MICLLIELHAILLPHPLFKCSRELLAVGDPERIFPHMKFISHHIKDIYHNKHCIINGITINVDIDSFCIYEITKAFFIFTSNEERLYR